MKKKNLSLLQQTDWTKNIIPLSQIVLSFIIRALGLLLVFILITIRIEPTLVKKLLDTITIVMIK